MQSEDLFSDAASLSTTNEATMRSKASLYKIKKRKSYLQRRAVKAKLSQTRGSYKVNAPI